MVIVIFLVITIITESSWSHDHHIAFQAIQLLPQLCPTTGFGPTVGYRHSHNQSHESMVDHRELFTVSFQVQSLFSLLNKPLINFQTMCWIKFSCHTTAWCFSFISPIAGNKNNQKLLQKPTCQRVTVGFAVLQLASCLPSRSLT